MFLKIINPWKYLTDRTQFKPACISGSSELPENGIPHILESAKKQWTAATCHTMQKGTILVESDYVLILPNCKIAYARKKKSYILCKKWVSSWIDFNL